MALGTGEKDFYCMGNRNQLPNFEGEQGNKDNIGGAGNIRKLFLYFWGSTGRGEGVSLNIYFRGTREQVSPG